MQMVVDFNSYFSSVEQHLRPELRGRPVAVVPVAAETTSCIAASYEAKAFGVKTGTRAAEARKMCPGIHLLPARPEVYVEYHHRLIAAVESCVHVEQVLSIDEMVCIVPENFRTEEKVVALARAVKAAIAEQVGVTLRCSIGIASNRFLAKTASDMQKPNGLVVIRPGDLPEILFRLELRDLCGIGENMEKRLVEAGIRTVRELWAADAKTLRRVWHSVEGERFYRVLRGEVLVEEEVIKRTLGHSHVLPPRERNERDAFAVLHRLTQKAAMRLRAGEYWTGGLQVMVKDDRKLRWVGEVMFQETQDTLELLRRMEDVWRGRPSEIHRPLAVGVTLFRLVVWGNLTPSLFQTQEGKGALRALPSLHRAIDELNRKFGKNTVYYGGAHGALGSAPMRIAFNRIPDLETEGDG
jgi:DNA polymerase IV